MVGSCNRSFVSFLYRGFSNPQSSPTFASLEYGTSVCKVRDAPLVKEMSLSYVIVRTTVTSIHRL
jgi:hypothetical protein